MTRKSPGGNLSSTHKLLTDHWAEEVEAIEVAIGRLQATRPLANDCSVVFFEIAHDGHLHVNVTHRYPTKEVRGWAGPAHVDSGFLHNRTFADAPTAQVLRHIRDMVFAAPL
jgi:hypothetical protein